MSHHASPITRALQIVSREKGILQAGPNTASAHERVNPEAGSRQTSTDSDDLATLPNDGKQKHNVHRHLTLMDKFKISKWMVNAVAEAGTEKLIQSKTIANFPEFFKGSSCANFMRAKRIWQEREKLCADSPKSGERKANMVSVTSYTAVGKKRIRTKARKGRGRAVAAWVQALETDLVDDFERFRRLGMKISPAILKLMAKRLISSSPKEDYHNRMLDGRSYKPIQNHVDASWVQRFMCRHNIVLRKQAGKLAVSPEVQQQIHRRVAYFLGNTAREFMAGTLLEENVENADETHFLINVDDKKTLGFRGDDEVKYADVTSGGEGMTMLVRISGGALSMVEAPFMIFKNLDRSYPIRGLPDDVPGVSYRSGPKGWIDNTVMQQWAQEPRALEKLPQGRRRVLFMDNCSGHKLTDALLEKLEKVNTEIRFFPPNATDLLQPADSFVIQKIKMAWTQRWEEYKARFLQSIEQLDGSYGTRNGCIPNPGKRFFLKIAAQAVRDVNKQRDENGWTYARKAMIRCGLAKQPNGLWEISQLFPHLQNIVHKHRNHFDGEDPDDVIVKEK